MADGSAPEDLWHLTIDDLLSSPPEPKPIGGAGPYVINLSASTAPISLPPNGLLEFEHLHLYQVQQRENGQQRFRLRLGPIASELEADAILGTVREHYPRALTAAADEDDLRAIAHAAARNDRNPARSAAPAVANRSPVAASLATPPLPPQAAEAPAKTPPATATENHARSAPAPAPANARSSRIDDPVSARELAEMFLAAEPVATIVSKIPSVPAAPVPAPSLRSPVPAQAPADGAKPAPQLPVVNAKLASPPPDAPPVYKAKGTAPTPRMDAQPVDKATATAPTPRMDAPPVQEVNAAPPPPPVEMGKATLLPPPALIEQSKAAAAFVPPARVEQAKIASPSPPVAPVAAGTPVAMSIYAPVVPVLGIEQVATRRSFARRAPTAATAAPPERERIEAPPTLRSEPLVAAPAGEKASVKPLAAILPSNTSRTPAAPPTPSSLLSESGSAALFPVRPPRALAAHAAPPRVALSDFFAREAPAFVAAEWAPATRAAAETPLRARVAKSDPAPTVSLEPPPLSLEPSPPRQPLADPIVDLSPARAVQKARPARSNAAVTRPPALATPAPPVRPTDLLAEIAAARSPPAQSPMALPPSASKPPATADATTDAKPAPAVLPLSSPATATATASATGAAPTTWLQLDDLELVEPTVARAPAVSSAPMVAAPSPTAAPKAMGAIPPWPPVAVKAPTVVPAPSAAAPKSPALPLAPIAAALKAPTVIASPPKVAPVDRFGKPRAGAQAPNPPTRPSPVRPATTPTSVRPVNAPTTPLAEPAAAKAPAVPAAQAPPKPVPALDRTQTVRALTSLELEDGDSSRLFAIQLAVSESDFRPEDIPNLGIFDEYRLYSTIGLDGDKVLHALRLGFFTDEGAAGAVAGYLRSYFEGAALKRVSAAERDRFAEQRVKARKDAGVTGIHAAIELSSPDLKTTTSLADLTQRASRRRSDEPRR